MLNKKSLSLLAFLVLGTSILTGCGDSPQNQTDGQNSQTKQAQVNEKEAPIFTKLNNEYKKVDRLIKTFIDEIDKTTSLQEANNQKINSKEAKEAVKILNETANQYKPNQKLIGIIEKINTINVAINVNVLDRLEKGITKDSIQKVIDKLKNIQELNINVNDPNNITDDQWNDLKVQIKKYLENKLRELQEKINDIKINETEELAQITQKQAEDNTAKISRLESKIESNSTTISNNSEEINKSQNDINNISFWMGINNLFTVINLILLILILLVLLNNIFNFKPQNHQLISGENSNNQDNSDETSSSSQSDQISSDTEIDNRVKTLENKITEINNRVDENQRATEEKIESINHTVEQNQQTTQREISDIKDKLKTPQEKPETTTDSNNNDNGSNYQPEKNHNHQGVEEMPESIVPTPNTPTVPTSNIDLSKLNKNSLVNIYNNDPEKLFDYVIEVVESDDTIKQRRAGSNVSPELIRSKRKKGICWIIQIQETLYLVPKANLKVNRFVSNTIEFLFDCQNYQKGDSEDFTLEEPAEVLTSGENWILKEKGQGILKFESLSS